MVQEYLQSAKIRYKMIVIEKMMIKNQPYFNTLLYHVHIMISMGLLYLVKFTTQLLIPVK